MKGKILKLILIMGLGVMLQASANVTPYDSLTQKAKAQGKNLVIYFCGSDWCATCNKFKKSVLSNADVSYRLNNNFVYYVADFPQRTKLDKETTSLNNALAEKLNPKGIYPILLIADCDLKILKSMDASTTIEQLKTSLNTLK
jgi:thioredoxin-related protein